MREPTGCTVVFRRRAWRERGGGPCLGAVLLLSAVTVLSGTLGEIFDAG